jgi:hypothetical protein
MTDQNQDHSNFFDTIAHWIKDYHEAIGQRSELANLTPEVVASIARDVGVSSEELSFFAAKGKHAADELPKLLRALGVDPEKLTSVDPAKMRDLQRICLTCGHKGKCRHDLASDTVASHYQEYCPNAISLDAILKSK